MTILCSTRKNGRLTYLNIDRDALIKLEEKTRQDRIANWRGEWRCKDERYEMDLPQRHFARYIPRKGLRGGKLELLRQERSLASMSFFLDTYTPEVSGNIHKFMPFYNKLTTLTGLPVSEHENFQDLLHLLFLESKEHSIAAQEPVLVE